MDGNRLRMHLQYRTSCSRSRRRPSLPWAPRNVYYFSILVYFIIGKSLVENVLSLTKHALALDLGRIKVALANAMHLIQIHGFMWFRFLFCNSVCFISYGNTVDQWYQKTSEKYSAKLWLHAKEWTCLRHNIEREFWLGQWQNVQKTQVDSAAIAGWTREAGKLVVYWADFTRICERKVWLFPVS